MEYNSDENHDALVEIIFKMMEFARISNDHITKLCSRIRELESQLADE